MKYKVLITATVTEHYRVVVDTEDENKAESKAMLMFGNGEVQCEWRDCDLEFEVEEL